ncbi:hypothetical protein SUGI_0211550 [Cryptomeria japonica]|nr:hypothetical protein SUGI_0211550 [Cryptomeria japonica]
MEEANTNAQSCTVLHSIMGNSGLDQNQCLCRVSRNDSWMEAISRIFTLIAYHKIGVDMKDAFEAYSKIQDVLKFMLCPDNIVVDPLNIFGTLNFMALMNSIFHEEEMLEVERELKQPEVVNVEPRTEELVTQLNRLGEEMFNSPLIRLDATSNDKVEELGKKMFRIGPTSYVNLEELGEMLRNLVGHVIVSCLLEASDVLVKYSGQWAKNLEERKIEGAIEVAGKVSGPLEKLVKDGDLRPAAESGEVPSDSGEKGEDIEAAAYGGQQSLL